MGSGLTDASTIQSDAGDRGVASSSATSQQTNCAATTAAPWLIRASCCERASRNSTRAGNCTVEPPLLPTTTTRRRAPRARQDALVDVHLAALPLLGFESRSPNWRMRGLSRPKISSAGESYAGSAPHVARALTRLGWHRARAAKPVAG